MKLKKEHLVILAIQVTEILGFSLVLPFLPLFAEQLGADPLFIGVIFASFSFFQFISAPIMGSLSDRYGRKPMLILSQFSTFVSFIILGLSGNVWMVMFSRIIDGLLGSNLTIAQAYMSDISEKKDRSKAFGLTGIAFGIGFMIGPAAGGFLSQYSYSLPPFLAAGASFLTIVLTWVFLRETVDVKKSIPIKLKIIDTDVFKRYSTHPEIAPKLFATFAFILSHVVLTTTLALYASRQFGFGAVEVGYVMAFMGVMIIFHRGFLLPKLIDLCGEISLSYIGMLCLLSSFLLIAVAGDWLIFVLAMVIFSFGNGLVRPMLSGAISRAAPDSEQGAAMGVANSYSSIAMIIGPLFGGILLQTFFAGSIGIASAVLIIIAILLMLRDREFGKITDIVSGAVCK